MYLTHLSLTDFRIFSRLDQEVPKKSLILVGENAQGKTTLLESVYFLSAMESFQAGSAGELINFFAQQNDLAVSRIVADYIKGGNSHHLEVRIIQNTAVNGSTTVRKEVLLDGRERTLNEVIGHFNAVLFLPDMMQIITGSPSRRRHYLDVTISQVDPKYNEHTTAYNRSLTQRNALLKQLKETNGDPDQLSYWDEKIIQSGSYLILARILALKDLEQLASSIHADLTRGEEILRLQYLPQYDPLPAPPGQMELPIANPVDRSVLSLEEIQQGFREELLNLREQEILRGVTTIGPHRDEVIFLSNGLDLGRFGSRGQIRTTLLSLKLAEIAWFKEKTGHWPVLLLDEVLAELDDIRRNDLLERLTQTEQALLTTTDLSLFSPEFQQTAARWRVHSGQLEVE